VKWGRVFMWTAVVIAVVFLTLICVAGCFLDGVQL
jgi:hypothetical protein